MAKINDQVQQLTNENSKLRQSYQAETNIKINEDANQITLERMQIDKENVAIEKKRWDANYQSTQMRKDHEMAYEKKENDL